MIGRIGYLGDRLLAHIVPKTRAAAVVCWYEYASVSSPCIRRYCCTGTGIPDGYCTPYRPC